MSGRVDESKRRLRGEMSERRRSVSGPAAAEAAESAAHFLMASLSASASSHRSGRVRRIALYAALADELPTRPLFEAVVESGADPLLPRAVRERELEFASVTRWEDLRRGRFGVMEPPADAPMTRLDPDDVVVVPGVAFDRAGHRLGRGRGYYDRTFPPDSAETPMLIGFGYHFQLIARVPHDSRDRRVDVVVTERGAHCCAEHSP